MRHIDFSLHNGTPTVTVRDNRGLGIRDIAYHRHPDTPEQLDERITRHRFNALAQLEQSIDPRLHERQAVDATTQPNYKFHNSLTGDVLRSDSADAGVTLSLNDVHGRPCLSIGATGVLHRWHYETPPLAGRLLHVSEHIAEAAPRITERLVWGDNTQTAKDQNLAGRCVRHYDTAGCWQTDSAGLTASVLSATQKLLTEGTEADWQGEDAAVWDKLLAPDAFTTSYRIDATGAAIEQRDALGHTRCQTYDIAGMLRSTRLIMKGGTTRVILKAVEYSAFGQKLWEEQGNGVITTYTYEQRTQRLLGSKIERRAGRSEAKVLQDIRYEYDPVGNILSVHNDAEATRFWRNQKIVPVNRYEYDSLYQLISASGREMADMPRQGPRPPSPTIPLPTNDGAYTNYTRRYQYDRAGNLTRISHSAPASNNSYTLDMTVSNRSNRAVLHTLADDPAKVDALFDAAGNQLQLQPGQSLHWTPRGQLGKFVSQAGDDSVVDQESYRYGADGQRVAKFSTQQAGAQTRYVLYLPGLEMRARARGDGIKERLHVITVGEAGNAQVRLLHWETGTPPGVSNDSLRYSYSNLIDSVGLELDSEGHVISHEEYYPYGGSAVWAARSQTEADYKTVRYSGKERDGTGLYYYGHRYYQPWVGRWLSADPAGTVDGLNLYRMVRNNPIALKDNNGLNAEGYYYEYQALKTAPNMIRNTRLQLEDYLRSQTESRVIYVLMSIVLEALATTIGMAGGALGGAAGGAIGGAIGGVVASAPGAVAGAAMGASVGGLIGKTVVKKAAEKLFPQAELTPELDMSKKIKETSQGGLRHKIKKFMEKEITFEKLNEKVTDHNATENTNAVARGVGLPELPTSLPVSKAWKIAKELKKSITVDTKEKIIREMPAQIESTRTALNAIYSSINAQFGKLSSMRIRRSLLWPFIADGQRELSITLNNAPHNPYAWVGKSEVKKSYDEAIKELDKLNALYVRMTQRLEQN
ncbi:RHS repeat-associated core domain-containing protein [Pseudomonas guariconensis]|uniref:RHS repeat-associated core domain-containing protein n=1 Tax=Pseudomonas guariconensis TaxID=1288410 RepID=UPI00384C5413